MLLKALEPVLPIFPDVLITHIEKVLNEAHTRLGRVGHGHEVDSTATADAESVARHYGLAKVRVKHTHFARHMNLVGKVKVVSCRMVIKFGLLRKDFCHFFKY